MDLEDENGSGTYGTTLRQSKPAPPRRVANLERRSREHLTFAEVERLINAAGSMGRHHLRDATLILVAYRHGAAIFAGRPKTAFCALSCPMARVRPTSPRRAGSEMGRFLCG